MHSSHMCKPGLVWYRSVNFRPHSQGQCRRLHPTITCTLHLCAKVVGLQQTWWDMPVLVRDHTAVPCHVSATVHICSHYVLDSRPRRSQWSSHPSTWNDWQLLFSKQPSTPGYPLLPLKRSRILRNHQVIRCCWSGAWTVKTHCDRTNQCVKNALFNLMIYVADGAPSNTLIKKSEVVPCQMFYGFQFPIA